MNPLTNLRSLLRKLRKDEIKTLLLYLEIYQTEGRGKSKSYQLVQMLIDETTYSSLDIQRTLYNRESTHAFYKLISRLREKVYEVILFDQHLSDENYAKRNRTIFISKKKLLVCEVLMNKGVTDDLENKLKEIIRDARDYEIYDVLSQALIVLRRLYVVTKKDKQVSETSSQIAFYKKAEFLLDNANSEFSKMINKINFSFDSNEYESELLELVENLKNWYKETKSASIGFNYLLLQVEYQQLKNDFKAADKSLIELGDLLDRNKVFSTNNRMGTWRLNYAGNLIYLGEFNDSYYNAKMAFDHFKGVFLNEVLSLEVMFYAKFYMGDYQSCIEVLSTANSKLRGLDSIVIERFRYYNSVLKFVNGKFAESNQILTSLQDIKRDKEGWNVVRKIIQLLCKIELKELDSVDLQVQNLQKYIKRISASRHVRQRYLLILRILIKLINENYNYDKTYLSRKKYFDLLESGDSIYIWKAKSPELFSFNEWFKRKLKAERMAV